jgi:DNA-binding response OmpR family regulator
LIVDDNRDTADSLAEFLRLAGHTVHVAYEPSTAVALAAAHPPDVLVTDIGLPVLNGFDLATRIRSGDRRMLAIAVTGYGTDQVRELCKVTAFDHYIVKPAPPEELVRILAEFARSSGAPVNDQAIAETPSEGTMAV